MTPVVRSFVSIPAGVVAHAARPLHVLTFARHGDLVLRPRRRRLGARRELGGASTTPSATSTTRSSRSSWRGRWRTLMLAATTAPASDWRSSSPVRRSRSSTSRRSTRRSSPSCGERFDEVARVRQLHPRARTSRPSRRRPPPTSACRETVGVANGTDALVLVLDALGIGPGDEVICPAFTFYATAEAIARVGATPVFADIDPATLNLDPADVAARITPRTKAIMPVHLFGRPAPLGELADSGMPLIEDAAQAFGAPRASRTTGIASTFSFYPDEEPLRARRRRPRRLHATTELAERIRHAALPRLARQEDVRARRLQLAPRRAPGGGAAALPRELDGWNAAAPRGRRALRASSGSASSSSCRPTSPGHVYHLYVVPLARARPHRRRAARGRDRPRDLLRRRRSTCSRRSLPRLRARARCPRPSAPPRENLALPLWAGITRRAAGARRRGRPLRRLGYERR